MRRQKDGRRSCSWPTTVAHENPRSGIANVERQGAGLLGAGPMAVMRADVEEQLDLVKLELAGASSI